MCIFQNCIFEKCIFQLCVSKRLVANPDRMPGWRGDIMAGATFCATLHIQLGVHVHVTTVGVLYVKRVNTLSGGGIEGGVVR